MRNSKGSIWRKWDLHIHTPETKFVNAYLEEDAWDKFIKAIEESDVEVFGITDYFAIDNYYKCIELHKKKYPNSNKVFFPNIELRLEVSVNKKAEEVNLHILLDNALERKEIEDFLRTLKTNVNNGKKNLTCFDLSTDDHFAKASIQHIDIEKALADAGILKDSYLIIAASNNAGLRPDTTSPRKLTITDNIDSLCDAFFGGSQNVEYYLQCDRYEDKSIKAKPKPVFGGSDAHSLDDVKIRLGKQSFNQEGNQISDITWIKADTTFLGIKQVCNECNEQTSDRVYIGAEPLTLQRIREGKSKFISSITITHTDDSIKTGWFNSEIPINPGLVAIIGKKGSGKSALADIIALGGNTHIDENLFSFLHKSRFRKQSLAKDYKGKIDWYDKNDVPEFTLDKQIDFDSTNQRVKYLPQKYVEEICNELGVSRNFQKEINKVVYSYLPDTVKNTAADIEALLLQKTKVIEDEINVIRIQTSNLLDQYLILQDKKSDKYKLKLDEKLASLKRDLENLEEPKAVKKPKKELDKLVQAEIKKIKKEIKTFETKIANITSKKDIDQTKYDNLLSILNDIKSFHTNNKLAVENLNQRLNEAGIKGNSVSIKVDSKKIIRFRDAINKRIETYISDLHKYEKELTTQKEKLSEITGKQQKEFVLYENYLEMKKQFEDKKKLLKGKTGDKSLTTIKSVEEELQYIKKKIDEDLLLQWNKLVTYSKSIYEKLEDKKKIFEEVYAPLKKFISEDKPEQEQTESIIGLDVGINFDKESFINEFLSFINRSSTGSFRGKKESVDITKALITSNDITGKDKVEVFINAVLEYLTTDKTSEGQEKTLIENQLNSGVDIKKNLFSYLLNLSYLETKYRILFNGKDLNTNEFSPGEKGIVLLIFYLLIDKDDIPLIIDQPEENLDNESVYQLLVPYMKKAKKKRQIIMVTHNPNLAVVCDADQIIVSEIKRKSNEVMIRYTSGSIESPFINKKLVDILEGTMPAFDVRSGKYIR